MRFLFSDPDHAARAARNISRYLREQGAEASYTRCQQAVAVATGYTSWAELITVSKAAPTPSRMDRDADATVVAARREALEDALRAIRGVTQPMAHHAATAFPPTGSREAQNKPALAAEQVSGPKDLDELLAGFEGGMPHHPELDRWVDMAPVGREWGAPGWEELIGVPPALEATYVAAMGARFGIRTPVTRPQGGFGPLLDSMATAVKSKGLDWNAAAGEELSRLMTQMKELVFFSDGDPATGAITSLPRHIMTMPTGAGKSTATLAHLKDGEGTQVVQLPPSQPPASDWTTLPMGVPTFGQMAIDVSAEMTISVMEWEESERGWGTRPDGYSIHISPEAYETWLAAYWARMPKETPDEYERPALRQPISLTLPSEHPVVQGLMAGRTRIYRHDELHAPLVEAIREQQNTRSGYRR